MLDCCKVFPVIPLHKNVTEKSEAKEAIVLYLSILSVFNWSMVNLLHTFETLTFSLIYRFFPEFSTLLITFSELWLIELLGFSTTVVLLGQPWYINGVVLRTVLNIYNQTFLQKLLTILAYFQSIFIFCMCSTDNFLSPILSTYL